MSIIYSDEKCPDCKASMFIEDDEGNCIAIHTACPAVLVKLIEELANE